MSFWGILIVSWGLCLLLFDVHRGILPNALTLPALAVAVGWAMLNDPTMLWGALLWGGSYLFLALMIGGVGGGDVKLAPTLGIISAQQGLFAVLVAMVIASAITMVFAGISSIISRKRGALRNRGTPHGPGMLIAACIALSC
ncbi:prepilin peptidase [Corynebacterium gerontici]|uniref:Type IV leader peptidase family protein n=1 Tax=Corynebacterium gerontici TaxID=2079234 RepID=A0A3G6J152_9CORY|nr:A24 family peptidase [Corynebacterium gerontici]AZA11523.1 Type IV leader peptidase family protein [Corynebacterium gerontici]